MSNHRIRGRAYAARVVRALRKGGRSTIAEESASVTKALTLVAGLPTPMKEEVFVRLVVDELLAEEFAGSIKRAANA